MNNEKKVRWPDGYKVLGYRKSHHYGNKNTVVVLPDELMVSEAGNLYGGGDAQEVHLGTINAEADRLILCKIPRPPEVTVTMELSVAEASRIWLARGRCA